MHRISVTTLNIILQLHTTRCPIRRTLVVTLSIRQVHSSSLHTRNIPIFTDRMLLLVHNIRYMHRITVTNLNMLQVHSTYCHKHHIQV